jgi:hypothetical protein
VVSQKLHVIWLALRCPMLSHQVLFRCVQQCSHFHRQTIGLQRLLQKYRTLLLLCQ